MADGLDNTVSLRDQGGNVARLKRGWGYVTIVTLLRPLLMLLTKRDWSGIERIPKTGGCVLAANHVSEIDPLMFGHFVNDQGRWPRFLGKAEVFKVPIVGRIVASAGQIPVYRKSSHATKAFSAAVDEVNKGELVVVYPEGTISRDPDLWPMVGRLGAARIALSTGCPVIPCAQWGPNEVLAPYARKPSFFPRKTMQIRVGETVYLADLHGQELTPAVLEEATDRIMAAITAILEEIRGAKAPETRFNPRAHGIAEIGNPNDPRNKHRPTSQPALPTDELPIEGRSGQEGGAA